VTRIVELENRALVLMQWAWNYFTFNRSARLITGEGESARPLA
jgi:NADH dehydrogenase